MIYLILCDSCNEITVKSVVLRQSNLNNILKLEALHPTSNLKKFLKKKFKQ